MRKLSSEQVGSESPRCGSRRSGARRRGSILIMVVAVLVLLALMGTAYISTAPPRPPGRRPDQRGDHRRSARVAAPGRRRHGRATRSPKTSTRPAFGYRRPHDTTYDNWDYAGADVDRPPPTRCALKNDCLPRVAAPGIRCRSATWRRGHDDLGVDVALPAAEPAGHRRDRPAPRWCGSSRRYAENLTRSATDRCPRAVPGIDAGSEHRQQRRAHLHGAERPDDRVPAELPRRRR